MTTSEILSSIRTRFHTAGAASAAVTIAGLLSSPQVLGMFSEKWAAILTGVGIILQATTKPVHAGATDLVPKDDSQPVS